MQSFVLCARPETSRLDLHGRLCRQYENTCISSRSETNTFPTSSYKQQMRYYRLILVSQLARPETSHIKSCAGSSRQGLATIPDYSISTTLRQLHQHHRRVLTYQRNNITCKEIFKFIQ
jgi:hypothetical protein